MIADFIGGPLDGKRRAVGSFHGKPYPKYYVNVVPPVSLQSFDPSARIITVKYERHCYILRDDGRYEHVE
jgi:hypothetical protein